MINTDLPTLWLVLSLAFLLPPSSEAFVPTTTHPSWRRDLTPCASSSSATEVSSSSSSLTANDVVVVVNNKAPQEEIDRRRNLAIISHPDSGKTTMTEKLLLYGGALQQAGAVRQKAEQRATASDFMEMEQERGISISSTVMNFEYEGFGIRVSAKVYMQGKAMIAYWRTTLRRGDLFLTTCFRNLFFFLSCFFEQLMDTPGHQDFSEDTYRALAAADNAVS